MLPAKVLPFPVVTSLDIVIVFVAPVPEAVTLDPTKFNVVPAVDNAEPSSCTVIPPEETASKLASPLASTVST